MIRRFIECRVMPSSFAAETMFPVVSSAFLHMSRSAATRSYESRTMEGAGADEEDGVVVDMTGRQDVRF
jgi:hypothetical protein